MIFIERKEPDTEPLSSEVREWRQRARDATREVVLAPNESRRDILKARAAIWQSLKPYLIWLFHGKCAFCESKFLVVSFGDVEHFRPKRGVKEDPSHPGYYWLAFEEANLLPSCERCNRNAKGNHFPINGQRVTGPDASLEFERPLLVNPCESDPMEHLDFSLDLCGLPTGLVRPLTEIGRNSIQIFNLNREDLVEARRREQDAFINRILFCFVRERVDEIGQILRGLNSEPYTASCLAAAQALAGRVERDLTTPLRSAADLKGTHRG